ncbi:MAG: hypothetical protein BMS9Abin36_0698 [Gammaproteobacteria bacterium]|nr:MAG: hypothetical protein BMS9Abin36_0698 [Gammaproteobacteria bacterium]
MANELESAARADIYTTAAARQIPDQRSGRLLGWLSIAAAPAALLLSPLGFSIIGFFLALAGLVVAAPEQRSLSLSGIALCAVGGVVGYFFNTAII